MRAFRLALATATLGAGLAVTAAAATPAPPLPPTSCGGNPLARVETEPYVCLHAGGGFLYVGTCAVGEGCEYLFEIPLREAYERLSERLQELADDLPPGGCGFRPACR